MDGITSKMERSINKTIVEAQDVAAGLQVFADGIRRDVRIGDSIRELLFLIRGLEDLHLGVENLSRLPPPLESDVRLLLQSLRLSFVRLEYMFGDTGNTKLNGEVAYNHIWHDYCKDLQKNEDGLMLLPRLELYSVFLKSILQWLAGYVVRTAECFAN
jgi:hypothetical protein